MEQSKKNQDAAIEFLLRSKYGEWFPCYELADLALQYCRAVNSIRKRLRLAGDRERIENRKPHVNGKVHGAYRIILTADLLAKQQPTQPQPTKSWEQVCAERDIRLSRRESAPELVLT